MVRIEYEDAVHAVGQATARRLVELLRASGPRYIPPRVAFARGAERTMT